MKTRGIYLAALLAAICGCAERFGEPAVSASGVSKGNDAQLELRRSHVIDWDSLPGFDSPFVVVYEGPVVGVGTGAAADRPLQHGFSHIGWKSVAPPDAKHVPPSNRAVVWTGIVAADGAGLGAPWHEDQSPWGNDLGALREAWDSRRSFYREYYGDDGPGLADVDLLVIDVESNRELPDEILQLRDTRAPESTDSLGDDEFIAAYAESMRALYHEAIAFVDAHRQDATPRISSYSDSPIVRTWHQIDDHTWDEWQSDERLTSRLIVDPAVPGSRSEFYELQDFIAPSAYLFYTYESHGAEYAGRYLAYVLFQVEANQAWSDKEVILFAWLRHVSREYYGEPVADFMAESLAIFPFMAGADGLWMWEDGRYKTLGPGDRVPPYAAFVQALSRLSAHAWFFDEPDEFVRGVNARDLFVNRLPVWRAVAKADSILVAAQNPFAEPNEPTTVTVNFGDWTREIELRGRQVHLEAFTLASRN